MRYPGFNITRGVRQGCPISPLLFAACSDLFIRRLKRLVPKAVCRAYADDLALVVANGWRHIHTIQLFFNELERVSGLGLNIPKTVLVPLDPFNEEDARARIQAQAPVWGGLVVAASAKYLGFFIGPGRGELSWNAPLDKFMQRAEQWGKLGAGLLMTLKAFKVYIASVLLFVGQLEELPSAFKHHEACACRKLFPGPMNWMTADGFRELKTLHFPEELKDIHSAVIAAKARVVNFEANGALDVQNRSEQLECLTGSSTSCSLVREGWLGCWRNQSFLLNLNRARQHAQAAITRQPAGVQGTQRTGWQGRVAQLIYGRPKALALVHLRKRLDHWQLRLSPGLRLNRASHVLQVVSNSCQPRVWAAILRLLCNGWCTASRFGGRGNCRLGCGTCDDSIRHLACCPVARRLFAESLGIPRPALGLELDAFLFLDSQWRDVDHIKRRAWATYALYRTYNGLRHRRFHHDQIDGAFDTFLREGLRGSEY